MMDIGLNVVQAFISLYLWELIKIVILFGAVAIIGIVNGFLYRYFNKKKEIYDEKEV